MLVGLISHVDERNNVGDPWSFVLVEQVLDKSIAGKSPINLQWSYFSALNEEEEDKLEVDGSYCLF